MPSPAPSLARSGLLRLRAAQFPLAFTLPAQARAALWALIGANDHTYRCWSGIERLRLLDAFALHHGLDPDRLWWNASPHWSLTALEECFEHGVPADDPQVASGPSPANRPLACLHAQLYVAEQRWRAETCGRCHPCPLVDEVHVETALEFFDCDEFPVIDLRAPLPAALPPCRHSTPLLEILEEARRLHRTPEEGGTYVPGDLGTQPDVPGFLRKSYPALSDEAITQIAHLVRPIELRHGRPHKRGTGRG